MANWLLPLCIWLVLRPVLRPRLVPVVYRFGVLTDRWVEKLKSSTAMLKFYCITYLIRFMMNESEKMMKGSVREDDFFIAHNALVLTTAKETLNWMRNNGYLHQ